MRVKEKLREILKDNSGSWTISTLVSSIAALTGSAVVLAILYTAIKVLAAKTGQTVINISP
ncbi:hypothetical protein [Desulfoscipio geothermicus]|uniref:Uncharacterized protein n=1 Tax=Desulfoscipio geothermicus DSM 3669 TaxID=1121426 RepID=A0A1I6E4M4_9FIRM|nr:hypothetical protein [Desulfoscipio geothermicus]SFR12597.1 hypothetical protein SAMN05660706_12561 [Desulfoscipio geothermicus DSM 3669]